MEREQYGYINGDGYLRSRWLEPYTIRYRDSETGETKERTVSIEEQIGEMGDRWKPVDMIDPDMLVSDSPEDSVFARPYDNGDRISYRYEKSFRGNAAVRELKESLRAGDYKIIKCFEAYLQGEPMPYDIGELHSERQAQRDRIKELEAKL